MNFSRHLLCALCLLVPLYTRAADAARRTILVSPAALAAAKANLTRADSPLQPALTKLRNDADRALKLPPLSVMDKSLTSSSGDKHDYYSFGPYWWPDPNKPDGLPYIRRDGEVNPATRTGLDDDAFSRTAKAIATLSLAYRFTDDSRYADRAALLARVWFLDPATRMNPNLQHAQAIPGINDGRGIGIIESRALMEINEGLALLADSAAWTPADRIAYTAWLNIFFDWFTTSANAEAEQSEPNNHGSWYDAQQTHLALVLGHPDDARKILTEGLTRRIAHQIQPDGTQPLELARTKSLDYSCFNLEALFTCAEIADTVGVDWWNYTTPDGRSLRAALNTLAPYADPTKAWPKQDLHEADRSRLIQLLARFLAHRADPTLQKIYTAHAGSVAADARWRLVNNLPPSPEPATAEAIPTAKKSTEITPLSIPGSEPFVFRQIGATELRLHVVKPAGWMLGGRRPCFVSFFGGGWNSGNPRSSVPWATWAASLGFVGIAPDYRTRERQGGTPEDCISDGRAAVRWIVAHAEELGIDPTKIISSGGSSGGHVAAWTAIATAGPAKDDPAPTTLPVALILLNPVSDTKAGGYGGPKRFGGDAARALASSVPDQMPTRMPPTLIFHGTADTTVPYANSVALRDKLLAQGNRCELVTFEGLGHSYYSTKFGDAGKAAEEKTKRDATTFLTSLGLLTAANASTK